MTASRRAIGHRCIAWTVIAVTLTGCALTSNAPAPASRTADALTEASAQNTPIATQPLRQEPSVTPSNRQTHQDTRQLPSLTISAPKQTGKLRASELNEISGMSASTRYPGLIYAINDSGNANRLYAIDETGQLLFHWNINVRNRDWEDMSRITLNDEKLIVIGDTGDNLKIHKTSALHFFEEPAYPASNDTLQPTFSVTFNYEDGPRNVEAFAAIGNTIYLLSKEPVNAAGRSPSGVYKLALPANLKGASDLPVLTAVRIGTMPLRAASLETRLAAAIAGVDLTHPTSMAFDESANTAYVLTYREVLRIEKAKNQTWADAFAEPAEQLHPHALPQAEALTTTPGRALWFTSENAGAPLWAIPLEPQL